MDRSNSSTKTHEAGDELKKSTNVFWSSPSAELDRLGRFQGFSAEADRYVKALSFPS